REGEGGRLEYRAREVRGRREEIGLPEGPGLVLRAREEPHAHEAVVEQGHALATRVDEGGHARREDERVPKPAERVQAPRRLLGGLLPQAPEAVHGALPGPAQPDPGLDPAVVGISVTGR